MPNISKEQLQNIASEAGELLNGINNGVKWVNGHLKNEQKTSVSYKLKTYRRKLKKIKNAITQKPVIALFGASQVGKSYLVKNILSDHDNSLKISNPNGERAIDFIKEMNPEGQGDESTSVVTRFTFDPNQDKEKPPVKIQLFTAKDLIIILCDSFLSDFKKRKEELKAGEIEAFLETIEQYVSQQNQYFLDEDDVYDIQDYIHQLFYESSLKSRLMAFVDADYWHQIAQRIQFIQPENWVFIFELLWGKQEKFTGLFKRLVKELASIKFPKDPVFSGFEAVLREEGTILDVKILKTLYTDSSSRVTIETTTGKSYNIERSVLCALSAEVILNISEGSVKKNPFIQDIDLLDFPGARTRLKLDETEPLENEKMAELLLRGKVSYLFNSYSLSYKINNLFICTHNTQTNVRGLPELLYHWIGHNIGYTKDERQRTLQDFVVPPLFIIFTFWNMQLHYDQDLDNPSGEEALKKLEYKWNLRFDSLFKQELLGTFDWKDNWKHDKGFTNFYLLRDYKYSKDTFSDFEIKRKETEVHKHRTEYYEALQKSFQQSKLVNSFFPNPKKIWDETSTPNKDGSEYIINDISKISNNVIKTNRFLGLLNEAREEVLKELDAHFESDRLEEQLKKAIKKGSMIRSYVNVVFGDPEYFGYFIEKLSVSESQIFKFYHNSLRDIKTVKAETTNKHLLFLIDKVGKQIQTDFSYEENLEILRKEYHLDTLNETEMHFQENLGIDLHELFYGELHRLKNRSLVLAEEARDFWYNNQLNLENYAEFIERGFLKNELESFFENIKKSFEKLNLTEKIAEYIRIYVDRFNRIDAAEDMIAHITAGIINEFVTTLGWSFYPQEEKNKIKKTIEQFKLVDLEVPEEPTVFESIEEEPLERLFDIMGDLNQKLNDLADGKLSDNEADIISHVPMLKNLERWKQLMRLSYIYNCNKPTYDPVANANLGEILEKIRFTQFSLA